MAASIDTLHVAIRLPASRAVGTHQSLPIGEALEAFAVKANAERKRIQKQSGSKSKAEREVARRTLEYVKVKPFYYPAQDEERHVSSWRVELTRPCIKTVVALGVLCREMGVVGIPRRLDLAFDSLTQSRGDALALDAWTTHHLVQPRTGGATVGKVVERSSDGSLQSWTRVAVRKVKREIAGEEKEVATEKHGINVTNYVPVDRPCVVRIEVRAVGPAYVRVAWGDLDHLGEVVGAMEMLSHANRMGRPRIHPWTCWALWRRVVAGVVRAETAARERTKHGPLVRWERLAPWVEADPARLWRRLEGRGRETPRDVPPLDRAWLRARHRWGEEADETDPRVDRLRGLRFLGWASMRREAHGWRDSDWGLADVGVSPLAMRAALAGRGRPARWRRLFQGPASICEAVPAEEVPFTLPLAVPEVSADAGKTRCPPSRMVGMVPFSGERVDAAVRPVRIDPSLTKSRDYSDKRPRMETR
jgi:hypothetical protein